MLLRLSYSPPSLHHFVMQGLPTLVVVLGRGFSLARMRLCGDLWFDLIEKLPK